MGKVEDQLINKYKADDSKSLVPRVDSHVGKDRFGVDVPFEIAARKFDPNAPSMADAEYVRLVAEWLVPYALVPGAPSKEDQYSHCRCQLPVANTFALATADSKIIDVAFVNVFTLCRFLSMRM